MKSVEKYRLFDLLTLSVLGIVLDAMCIRFTMGLVSFGLAISIIAMIRWGKYGLFVAAATGIGQIIGIQMLAPSIQSLPYELLLYVGGNLGIILAYICIPKINQKFSKKTFEILLLYVIISYVGQSFCRSFIVTLYVNDFTTYFDKTYGILNMYQFILVGSSKMVLEILSYSFIVGLVGNFLMPVLVAAVVLAIVNKLDGILVDPVEYLIQQREDAKRSYEVFEGFNLPDEELEKETDNEQDKEVDKDE